MSGAPGERPTLAIETSASPGSVALRVGGDTFERGLLEARAHAVDLFPAIRALFEEAGLGSTPASLARLERVLVGVGPGSFTGLRIGIAAARGLARGTGAEVVGLCSLAAIACDSLSPGQTGVVARDARAGRLYVARYRRTEEALDVLDEARALPRAEFSSYLGEDDALLADSAVLAAADVTLPPPGWSEPQPASARTLLALEADARHHLAPAPLYLFRFGESA